MDANFSEKNQVFFRFSYVDDPQFIPGIFGGIADGGGFQQGNQTAIAQQSALAGPTRFHPTLINEARIGFNYLHTTRVSPVANDLATFRSNMAFRVFRRCQEMAVSRRSASAAVNLGQQRLLAF